MGFLRGVPLLRPHPVVVWMGIAPPQSDARYPYGHTFSLKVNALSICQSNLDFHTRSYVKCQVGTLPRVYQVPKLGTRPFSKYNHRHLILHKSPGISFEKCAWFSKKYLGFLSPLPIPSDRRNAKCSCRCNFLIFIMALRSQFCS